MPLQKLQFRPGVNREGTNYSNEGGFYACNNIRFRSGYPEKLGGWSNLAIGYTFNGVARNLWNWVTYDSQNLLGVGTSQKFYVQNSPGSSYHDITPLRTTVTLGTDPFTTVGPAAGTGSISTNVLTISAVTLSGFTIGQVISGTGVIPNTTITKILTGSGGIGTYELNQSQTVASTAITGLASKLVVVTHALHGVDVNTYVTFTNAAAVTVGGVAIISLIPPTTYATEYEVVNIIDVNTYSIIASTIATSTASGGGAATSAAYQINAGSNVYSTGSGFGGGTWGTTGYGTSATITSTQQLRLWSNDNFEDNLLLNPRGGALYYWAKDIATYPRAVLLSDAANSNVKTSAITTATSAAGTASITVDVSDGINVGAVVTGTNIPAGTYVTTAYNYGLTVPLSANITGAGVASGATIGFSYAGRFVPNNVNQLIASDTNHFTIALGANAFDPTSFTTSYDPMLVRWSDQDNPFEWVPETSNQSGEQHLSNGSYLVCGRTTRQEILVWSDAALYSMQYLGPPYVWGFTLLMDNISITSPNAAITVNNVTYWMGVDKFYQYSGRVETLPCALRQFVYNNINKDQYSQIVCGSNEGFNEIWWHYASANSNVNDTYVIYNHLEKLWYYGSMARTAWQDSPLRQYPMAAFGVQTSYLSVALTDSATSIQLLNAVSYPNSGTVIIDSEQISYTSNSGNTLGGCVRGANSTTPATHVAYSTVSYRIPNQILWHEFGIDDVTGPTTTPIAAYIESSDFDIGDGHQFGFVWRVLPDLTFAGSSATYPQVLLTLKPRQNSGTAYFPSDNPTVTRTSSSGTEPEVYSGKVVGPSYTVTPLNAGQVYTRLRGRQMSFRMESVDAGVTWQLGAMRIDIRPDGRR